MSSVSSNLHFRLHTFFAKKRGLYTYLLYHPIVVIHTNWTILYCLRSARTADEPPITCDSFYQVRGEVTLDWNSTHGNRPAAGLSARRALLFEPSTLKKVCPSLPFNSKREALAGIRMMKRPTLSPIHESTNPRLHPTELEERHLTACIEFRILWDVSLINAELDDEAFTLDPHESSVGRGENGR